MKKTTVKEFCELTMGVLSSGNPEDLVFDICTDSRKAEPNQAFFAMRGEFQDGHKFVPMAYENGCRTFVISNRETEKYLEKKNDANIIMTEDTNKALRNLAKNYLAKFDLKKIGVTGSTGKTSTKEMMYFICSEKYKTARNMGNLNTDVGLTMTILAMEEGTEAGVFEMGMSALGEIDALAEIVEPQIGIITNIGTSHLEHLKTRENILKAKMEITNYFDENCCLVVNEINDLLTKENTEGNYKRVSIGQNERCDFIISDICDFGEDGIEFTVEHDLKTQRFKLNVPGRHNAINATLAVAAAMQLGISMEEAARGLAKMELTDKRLNIRGKDGIKVIDDTYNASPDSMKAGIDVLMSIKGLRKVAVLADILEMGPLGPDYHREVGEYAAEAKVDLVITTGTLGKNIAEGAKAGLGEEKVIYFEDKEKLMREIKGILQSGDVVLVKGSRGMAMDQVVKKIME